MPDNIAENRDRLFDALPADLQEVGNRAYEVVMLHLTVNQWWEIKEKYIALRLSDGGSDGVLYDTHRDAVRHQIHEQQCYYLSFRNLGAGGVNKREIAIVMHMARKAYTAGMRFVDPDHHNGGQELMLTTGRMDYVKAGFEAAAAKLQMQRMRIHGLDRFLK